MVAQDGLIVIENVYYFADAEHADANTADQDWTRRGLYTGPPFGNLDQDLQVMLERYLDERGVNTALALWIPEYIDFKEQKEYLTWLASKFFNFPTGFYGLELMAWDRCQVVRRCLMELVQLEDTLLLLSSVQQHPLLAPIFCYFSVLLGTGSKPLRISLICTPVDLQTHKTFRG